MAAWARKTMFELSAIGGWWKPKSAHDPASLSDFRAEVKSGVCAQLNKLVAPSQVAITKVSAVLTAAGAGKGLRIYGF
jgi:hypothetical protein